MKEEDRLAAVVARIDEEVGVVPRGAYMKTPLGEVVLNKSFQGQQWLALYYSCVFDVSESLSLQVYHWEMQRG